MTKIELEMVSRVWTKKQTQQTIKTLRDAGITVNKIDGGYKAEAPDGTLVFKAMVGYQGYLVRYAKELFI